MPGIVGLITRLPRERAERELLAMLETLQHESFYTSGTWSDEGSGVYVGWCVRKNSFSDGMPVRNERGDVTLAFSGEEFPEPGIAARLRERGHDVESTGPSYLVHLYEEDQSFPKGLNGRFHGLLADRSRGQAILFNDRYGMERLYCHESAEGFYFAAEAKAILAVRPELRRPDRRGLGEFVACGCALGNRTLFEGIELLPPGSVWTFRQGRLERKTAYFQPEEWENQDQLSAEDYYRRLRSAFTRTLPRYFDGQEPVAMSLTGGFDSRMIMACHKAEPGTLPCYTFGEDEGKRQCRDVVVAQQLAQACGQPHRIIPVGAEFLSRFAHYAERTVYLTDGCLSLVHCPDLYLNERAREIAPVRMTGNYGSEVLRFSRAFGPGDPLPGLFNDDFLGDIKAGKETYGELSRCHPVSFAVFRQAPWHHYGLLGLEQTQLALRSPYLDNEVVQTVFQGPLSHEVAGAACMRLISDGNADLWRIPTDRGVTANRLTAAGRVRRLALEFFFKAEYAYDQGMPQWVAKIDHAFSALHFDRLFLGRHKFHHFRIWYRDTLAKYVREVLLDPRSLSRDYLRPERVHEIVQGHTSGRRNYTSEIHKLLTLELMHRQFFDSKGSAGSAGVSPRIAAIPLQPALPRA
jgi:asparagine synthase (glutamine-hydrolysing)